MEQQRWFALYVKPRHEKAISAALRGRGYEAFLPVYQQRSTRASDLPLFPGYVFCSFDPTNRLPVLTVPGVFHIVGCAGAPVPLDPSEMEAIRKIVGSGLHREPCPHVRLGQLVMVRDGPLRGVTGIIENVKGRGRLIVSVDLLRRAVAVEIDTRWISAAAA